MDAFAAWVAKAVLALSDMESEQRRGLSGEWPLTYAISGAVACQVVGDRFFSSANQATTRLSREVTTNKRFAAAKTSLTLLMSAVPASPTQPTSDRLNSAAGLSNESGEDL